MKSLLLKGVGLAMLLSAGSVCLAGEEVFDIDARFRAKIAKEKVKQGAAQRADAAAGKGIDNANCGSQNIGNIDTGGRPGAAPREVFVFAPNAINLVTAGGCR